MKPYIVGLSALLAVFFGGASAGEVKSPQAFVIVNTEMKADGGSLLLPVMLTGVFTVKAVSITIHYEGDIGDVSFEATDYLYRPLVMPVRVDKKANTINISVAGTGTVVTRSKDGIIGYLKVPSDSQARSFEVVKAEIADGEFQKIVLNNTARGPDLHVSGRSNDAEIVEIEQTRLFQNFPNPGNPVTTIGFDVKDESDVRLEVFDVNGTLVRTLVNDTLDPNHYEIKWDGRDRVGVPVASGVYFYRIHVGTHEETRKLVILK